MCGARISGSECMQPLEQFESRFARACLVRRKGQRKGCAHGSLGGWRPKVLDLWLRYFENPHSSELGPTCLQVLCREYAGSEMGNHIECRGAIRTSKLVSQLIRARCLRARSRS